MKKLLKLLVIVTTMYGAMACSKTQIYIVERGGFAPYMGMYYVPQNSNGEYGITFGSYKPKTKAESVNGVYVGPNACGYDSFDVYAYKDGTNAVMNPYSVIWDEATSSWTYETAPQELQYFDRNSTSYDFIGVISDKASAYNSGSVEISGVEAFLDSTDEMNTPGELLWAGSHVTKSDYSAPVQLTFNHANAKMYIGFASDRNDTEIIDYTPSTPDIPATPDTYDTTGVYYNVRIGASYNVILRQGPAVADCPFITDADIDYINSMFTLSDPSWPTSSNILTMRQSDISGVDAAYKTTHADGNGTFFNAYKWLVGKYPQLASVSMNNWTSDFIPESKVIAHIGKVTNSQTGIQYYRAWFFDYAKQSTPTQYNPNSVPNYEVTITPGTPAVPGNPGLEGIRVFAVDKDANSKFVVTNHTDKANASISINSCTLTASEASDGVLIFGKPSGAVAQFATYNDVVVANSAFSPTTYYALPVGNPAEGYVVKFSYTYNGTTYYDARVNLPGTDTDFAQGYYYKYVIYITSNTNGTDDPGEATDDKDEVDFSDSPIKFNVTVSTGYATGIEKTYQL